MSIPVWPSRRTSPETPIETTGIQSIEVESYSGNVRRLALVGDEDSPGSNQVYGTNAAGTKGWKAGIQKIPVNTQTSSYTLTLEDQEKVVLMNSASANTLTIPPDSTVNFDDGTQILVNQYGAGETSIVAGSGVTIRSQNGTLALGGQYAGAAIIKIGSNEWLLVGNLAV